MAIPLSRTVERYIRTHAGIAECLRLGLLNQRALARHIFPKGSDLDISAAQMAIGRLSRRLIRSESQEEKIRREMLKARVLTRSNMMSVELRAPLPLEKIADLQGEITAKDDDLTVIHGTRNVTLILGQEHRDALRKFFPRAVQEVRQDLVKVQVLTSGKSKEMRGFSAFLYAQISAVGINLIQELTCSGEYLLLIEEKDLESCLQALRPRK